MSEHEHLSEFDSRKQKINTLRQEGIDPFPHSFKPTHTIKTILETHKTLQHGDEVQESYTIAGRLMAKRGHGKALFANIKDESGSIQLYANTSLLSDSQFQHFENLDIGDIIGLSGTPFVTKRGELSLKVHSVTLLTKTIHPLPEKFHGLQDKEIRYRKRYVDLIVNDTVKDVFTKRSEIIYHIRKYLHNEHFHEVETPVLHAIYGGAAARPFETHHNELNQNLYLRIALELHQKRLIVGGFERIFEIGRVFRNEGVSFKHNPEYTLMELYQAYADYTDMMNLTENLLSDLAQKITGSQTITYQETPISFKTPFRRITLSDALNQYAGVTIHTPKEQLLKKALELGLDPQLKTAEKGHLINFIYDKAVEHELIEPTFVMDYPWETSPLAKRHRNNPELVERFELIINGMEVANAYSELNDPIDQHQRFLDQQKAREGGDLEAHQMDTDFIEALEYGMPPTGGLGIGIDRVVMLLTNSASIRDVIFFPHLKTES